MSKKSNIVCICCNETIDITNDTCINTSNGIIHVECEDEYNKNIYEQKEYVNNQFNTSF